MSLDLKDFRGRITPETDAVLEAISRTTGRERQDIAREVLHEWAIKQVHAASLIDKLLRSEGLKGIDGGVRGNAGASEGMQGSGQRKAGRAG
jgi:hypothetical protein